MGRIPAIDGRAVISRADLTARGFPRSTVDYWYAHRAATGFPEKAGRIGRTDYWFEDEVLAWLPAHAQGKLAALSGVDRSGNPDDLLDAEASARVLGWSGRDSVHAARRTGHLPQPDEYGTAANGHPAPQWRRSTLWAFADSRPGQGEGGGRRPGTPGKRKPHQYAGDPRLEQALAHLRTGTLPPTRDLAAQWQVSERTAERIIAAARTLTSR